MSKNKKTFISGKMGGGKDAMFKAMTTQKRLNLDMSMDNLILMLNTGLMNSKETFNVRKLKFSPFFGHL